MNGIINTEEDATFFRERGIVVNQLKSDQEIANLWNGMSKSVKLTKVPKMDKVIEDVNKSCARVFHQFSDIQGSERTKNVFSRPWKIISNIPILKVIKEPIECMLEKLQGKERKQQKMKVTNLRHQESRKSQSHLSPK
ncbi:putative UPF0481 protein [Tanacetum coccineum]|uniref:UPF0481 protein n=1 Tax=Tanacetum coccineum TaxID=301880 RepID=A0ABQ5GVH3_9ASTR